MAPVPFVEKDLEEHLRCLQPMWKVRFYIRFHHLYLNQILSFVIFVFFSRLLTLERFLIQIFFYSLSVHAREKIVDHYKLSLRTQQQLTEGPFKTESETLFNMISTDLYIAEAQSEQINKQHEIWQLEATSKLETLHDPMVSCRSIFLASPG